MKAGLGRGRAQYLLRFDDLCPTMDRARWRLFVPLIERYAIRPILAVIPDNKDLQFEVDPPDPQFWEQMRGMQTAGATIGLHGFQHVCNSEGWGVIPVHRQTEFAGAPEAHQRCWIKAGLRLLRGRGLHPRIWVAPRHGFDCSTIGVLLEEGIELVSDGFSSRPYRAKGLTWIPQQLWAPALRKSGLWTICIHPATAGHREVAMLEAFLKEFGGQFTSVDRVIEEWPLPLRSMADVWFHTRTLARIRLGKFGRRLGLT